MSFDPLSFAAGKKAGGGSQPALPTLTDPAGAGDIRCGKDALDGNGDRIVGSMLNYQLKEWQSASLADFPTDQVLSYLPHTLSNFYGCVAAKVTLGGSPILINAGVMAVSKNGSLTLGSGGSNGSMAFSILLTGSTTGLSCLHYYVVSGGSLMDMTAQADQVISDFGLYLYCKEA